VFTTGSPVQGELSPKVTEGLSRQYCENKRYICFAVIAATPPALTSHLPLHKGGKVSFNNFARKTKKSAADKTATDFL